MKSPTSMDIETTVEESQVKCDFLATSPPHNKRQFSCEICEKKLGSRLAYSNHLKTHSGKKNFHCSICDKYFLLQKYLNQHMMKHKEDNPHVCNVCGRRMSTKQALAKHVFRKHEQTGERPFKCDKCDKTFVEQRDLVNHGAVHTDVKPFCCEHCGQRFRTKGTMDIHKRLHTGEKPFECDICHKRFIDNSSCISHRRVHTGEKPYKCSYCDYAFRVKHCLIAHIRKHTGERPYNCDQCEKNFRHRKDLVYHLNLHKGIKPYACNVCHKKFYQQANLKSHIRRHSDERPHICNICQKGFPSESSMAKHQVCHLKNKKNGESVAKGIDSVFNVIVSSNVHPSSNGNINKAPNNQEAPLPEINQSFSSSAANFQVENKVVESPGSEVIPENNFVEIANFISLPGQSKTTDLVVSDGSNNSQNNATQLFSILLPVIMKSVPSKIQASETQSDFSNESSIILDNNQFFLLNSVPSEPDAFNTKVITDHSQSNVPCTIQLNLNNNNNNNDELSPDASKSSLLAPLLSAEDGMSLTCELCNTTMLSTENLKEHLANYHRVAKDNINLKKSGSVQQVSGLDWTLANHQPQQQIISKNKFSSAAATLQTPMQLVQDENHNEALHSILIDQPLTEDALQQTIVALPFPQMESTC